MNTRYCRNRKIQNLLTPVSLLFSACTPIGSPTKTLDRFDKFMRLFSPTETGADQRAAIVTLT